MSKAGGVPKEPELIIFFDGACNLCNGAVRFIMDRDGKGQFYFASLQSDFARSFLARESFDPEAVESIVFYRRGELLTYSAAVIGISAELGGIWQVGSWLRFLPEDARDSAYRWIARNRYRWFGHRKDGCRVPTPEERGRFLD